MRAKLRLLFFVTFCGSQRLVFLVPFCGSQQTLLLKKLSNRRIALHQFFTIEATVFTTPYRHEPVGYAGFVQRRMKSNCVVIRGNVIIFAMDGNYWRQTRADVVNRRKLLRKLFWVAHAAKPLARIVPGVWSIKQVG